MFGTNNHYQKSACCLQWLLTLNNIFNVIQQEHCWNIGAYRSESSIVLNRFFPYLAHILTGMRGCVKCCEFIYLPGHSAITLQQVVMKQVGMFGCDGIVVFTVRHSMVSQLKLAKQALSLPLDILSVIFGCLMRICKSTAKHGFLHSDTFIVCALPWLLKIWHGA